MLFSSSGAGDRKFLGSKLSLSLPNLLEMVGGKAPHLFPQVFGSEGVVSTPKINPVDIWVWGLWERRQSAVRKVLGDTVKDIVTLVGIQWRLPPEAHQKRWVVSAVAISAQAI